VKKRKHVPLRSCVVCRTKRPKRELIRIVKTTDGVVRVDVTGRANGRGAYLCSEPACWVGGVTRGKLSQSLKAELNDSARERLITYAPGRENYQPPAEPVEELQTTGDS
jgi:predicted RNA-binding protein YlxR (DUF448 family)